jgi:hypothetical protein
MVTDFWTIVYPPSKSRRMRWAGHVVRMWESIGAHGCPKHVEQLLQEK